MILARIADLGLQPMLWPGWLGDEELAEEPTSFPRDEPPNSFHGEGVGWCAGTLFYREDCKVHGLLHEVGHLAQLSPEEWRALSTAHVDTSEDVALIFQVEICRGVAEMGIGEMLRQMTSEDYAFNGRRIDDCSASYWWRQRKTFVPAAVATVLRLLGGGAP